MNSIELTEATGKKRGHFASKCNRVAKLIEVWADLESKMVSMIERGSGSTDTARLAYATLLMMETGIRVGNESSAEGFVCENRMVAQKSNKERGIKKGDVIYQHPNYGKVCKTYGLTTLLCDHVHSNGKRLTFSFLGKKMVEQNLVTSHKSLVRHCPYLSHSANGNLWLDITYNELKKFVKKYVGKNYTPKDLRMAKVNIIFIGLFSKPPYKDEWKTATSKSARNKILGACIEETASIIGHTKGVCKSAYLSKDLITYILSTPMPPKEKK